jgi:NAD(P)H-flavin reductase
VRGLERWDGRVGFVPAVLQEIAPSSKNAFVLLCGPPIMLKLTLVPLLDLEFPPDRIITSLERRMSCGKSSSPRDSFSTYFVFAATNSTVDCQSSSRPVSCSEQISRTISSSAELRKAEARLA